MEWEDENSSVYLKELFMQAPVSFSLLCGKDLIIKMVNNRALEFSGMKREDVINKPFFEVYPELAEQGFRDIVLNVLNTGIPFRATELPISLLNRKKPEKEFINLTLQPLRNKKGKIAAVIGVATDVTMLVISRNLVRESEERYKGVFEAMSQGFCIVDVLFDEHNQPKNYVFLDVNPGFENILGIKDVVGKTALDLIPETAEYWINYYGEIALTGESKTVSGAGYGSKWYETYAFRLGDRTSRRVGVLFTDATQRKEEEDQRLLYSNQLEAEVEERTRELLRSNEDLLHFTKVASHDLREPVRKIETFIRRLMNEEETLPVDMKRSFLERTLKAIDQIKHMIDGVLEYSSVEARSAEFEMVDMNAVIENVMNDINLPEDKKVNFQVCRLPEIEGSKPLIYQLFYHLIHNSIKFSKPGQPVEISLNSATVNMDGQPYVNILISDKGIGFNPQFSEKIFESFKRLHAKDAYEGSGMGLAVCRKIVEKHHGRIYAAGEENKGASFCVELPVKQDEKHPSGVNNG